MIQFLNYYNIYYKLYIYNYNINTKQSLPILKFNNETVLILKYKCIITDCYWL